MLTMPLQAVDNLHRLHEPAMGRSTHHGYFPSSPAESLFQKKINK